MTVSGDSSALIVDLEQQEEGTSEAAMPLVRFEAADSETVADEPSQAEETLGLMSDSGTASPPEEMAPDPAKSPVTHTQMYAGVDVQPSTATASADPDFPVLGLPASYDLRTYGYVPPVENQGAIGSCWAFATYGSLESSILMDGGGAIDLSENHLKNYHGFDWGPTVGGNYYISEAYLSRWSGPVREADDPYHDYDDRPSPGGPPQYYVREVLEFNTDDELKNGLMTYGAIGTVMYMNTSYYNTTAHTYYYSGTANPNHAVTIVGWDDNKAVPAAPGAGAWLIQNSWGTAWGEGGYFWLSYYDRQGGNDGFSFSDTVPASTYQKVYYHDDFGSVGSWNISYAFNAFTASSEQDLTAVQFWTMADGAGYEIGVYDTFSGGSLTGWLSSTYGTSEYAGMHTVNLPAPVHLTPGNDFYIYLHITDGGTYPMSADWRYPGYSSACTAGAGQSYYSADGNTWTDLRMLDSTANFSIRGLVTTTIPPEITVSGSGASINDGDITPTWVDGTDFGSAPLGGATISRTFLVRNDGTGTLVLGPVTVPAGFTLTDGLPGNLAAGASDTFTVRLDTAVGGTKSGYVFIQNDDRDEHPFNFAITGVVPAPEVTVLGSGISIVDGDTSPNMSDGTDFGGVFQGDPALSRTFTVRNDGTLTLTLGAVTVPAGFTLTEGLSASLAPGASDTFTVRLDTAAKGTKAGDVSFSNNDSNENPFNFRITGIVSGPAGPGDLDVTFGSGGVVATDVEGAGRLLAVAIQSDGKIVAAGYTNADGYYFVVVRYNANGALDTSFDGDGMLTTGFGASEGVGHDVVIQPDGKIVVAGYSYSGSSNDFAVVRYNADGSLDASFGVGGTVITDLGSAGDHGYSLALQSDGKLVVAGGTGVSGAYSFALARYNPDGSLDSSFDGDGKVTTAIGSSSVGYGVALGPDGKIVVVGESGTGNYGFAVARYNPDGSLDTSFDGDGRVTTAVGTPSRARSVALQSDGKIVAAGESGNYSVALVRYNSDGSLDTSFDGDGQVTTAVGASSRGYGVALQSDGKIVVAGSSDGDFAVVRYNVNGSLDASFGADGKALASRGSDAAYSVALQSDGKIVVAGEIGYIHAAARFLGSPPGAEVTVLGNEVPITDGDTTPSTADGTDFGAVPAGGAAVSRTFTVHNDGGAALTLGTVTVPVGFLLIEGLLPNLAPGASDTFTIQLDVDVVGPRTGEVSFATNDSDENPFNFRIAGLAGNLAWSRPAVASTSYAGLPAANATDGDLGSRWSSEFSDNEWIYVDLGSTYSIREVLLRWESAYGQGYKIQVSGDASTWSDVYSTTTGDGDVDDIVLTSPASGRYVRMLGTQRATAYGYSLYELEVYGREPGPEVMVLGSGISIANADSTPSVADGTDFGSVTEGGAAVSRVFAVRNDGDSTLTLGAVTVPAGFTLTEGLSGSLDAGASDTFTVQFDSATVGTRSGDVSFATNDANENPFHFAITGTVSPPAVTVSVAPATVVEDGSASLVYTFTRSVAGGSLLTVSFSVGGTAVFGTDYTQTGATSFDATSGTVTIAADQTTASVTLSPTADTTLEPDETVILTVTAGTGYTIGTPAASTGAILNDEGNLALGKTATASTSYGGLPASNATDGDMSSRWSSGFSDSEWIYVDLGWVYTICRVVLPWEAAYGRGYKLQVSNDASSWSDVYSTTTGDGGIDDIALAAPAPGRYVRMLGTQRATEYGYSLYEFEVYSGAAGPEVTVVGNGIVIADGDTTPSAGDGTDFCSVAHGEAAVGHTFTVRNDGSEALTLGAVTVPAGFTLVEELAASLAPGASDAFTVQLDSATAGVKSGAISFSTNDSDENPFHFTVMGTVLAPPEITVLGNGVVIAEGDTTPGTADDTDFGSVPQGVAGISRTFTVRNDGDSPLTLGTVTVPAGFTLTEGLSASLAAGASDTFTVRLDTASVGIKAGEISFATNDSDENPFDFTITGTVLPAPEITVLGNGISITDGDSTPSGSDGTDFGPAVQGEAALSRTFTVRNDGTLTLMLGSVTVPAGFTLTEGLSVSLAVGESDTFKVQLDTATKGTKTGHISFSTDDPNENPFDFLITGRVLGPGDLDVTFGSGGVVATDVEGNGRLLAVAIQSDGKIVAAGYTNADGYHFVVVRYNANGALDTSFDGDGMLTTGFGTSEGVGRDVAIQADGRIVVAGYTYNASSDGFAVVRYNTDGSLDTSFGTGGKVITDVGGIGDIGFSVAVQPDGKIVVVGRSAAGSAYNFAVVRYNTDGSLDTSFDGDGKVITVVGSSSQAYSVVFQSDGKIVVAGQSDYNFLVVRYNANGSLDSSFGADGKVITDLGSAADYGYGLALQSDGKIVVAGWSGASGAYHFALVRYNQDGSLDASFDGDGKVATAVGSSSQGYGVALQSDGKIVVTGPCDGDFAVVRYNVNGSLDTSFGADGKALASRGSDAAYSVALQSDGKIVVAGEIDYLHAAVRFIGGPPAAETTVLGDGVWIADGDATPSTADATDFGSATQGAAAVSRVFTVRNDGTLMLTLGAVTVPTGFTLIEGLSGSLAPGASDTFTVELETATIGTKTGEISFVTNDPDENPFNFTISGIVQAPAPEIAVLGNGIPITNGDTTPSASDGTDFGSVLQGGTAVSHTFTVRNDGSAALTLGAVTLPAGFALTEPLAGSLDPGASDTFTVQLDTTTPGVRSGTISFSTNDSDENPFDFTITGAVLAPPEITVLGNGVVIADGDTTPSAGEDTDFGSVPQGAAGISRTFTVRNDGDLPLTLGEVTVPTGFTLTEGLSASLAAGASDTFTVRLDTATVGTKAGEISFATNDSDENPFNFQITGMVLPAPEITVLGNDMAIADGDTTPSAGDGTDFGSGVEGEAAVSHTFTVRNDGAEALTLGAVTVPAGYTLMEGLSASLAAGQSDTFTVQLDTATAGTKAGDISFTTNDPDENRFHFRITGTIVSAGNLALGRPATASTSYSGLPASNATDGDAASRWSSEFSDHEWIYVDLGSAFSIRRVVLSWEAAYGRGYTIQVSGDASSWSDVYSTTTGDGSVDNITLAAPASGRYVRMLGTQRATVHGYSLWEFEVYAGGGGAPEIAVLANGNSIGDGDATPSAAEGTDFGSVVQGGAAVIGTFTVRNDGTADLILGTVTVPTGFTLTEGLSSSLAPGASDTFTVQLEITTAGTKSGEISFSTNDSDENPFNFTVTGTVTAPGLPQVTVTVTPSAVAEDGPANLVYTFTRSAADSSPLTVSFSVGGTATYNTDYMQSGAESFDPASGTVIIPASQTTAMVTVDPTADTAIEPDVTVILTVTAGTGYTVGTPSAGTGTIQNDDASGNLALGRPATASTSYSGLPASSATDGNPSSRWSSQFSDNEWIYVDLGSTYTIDRVVLRWEMAYGQGYKIQVSSDASTWSDVYSTTTGDGGMDDITLATAASGRYVRMLGTQRGTMYGYSLYEIEVYGGGSLNHAPAVSDISKSLVQDTLLPFAPADFAAVFTDPDAGDSLQKIRIVSLPTHGGLALNGAAVTVDQEIPAAQIGTLVYTPNSGYTGSDSFQWNGSDGSLYAATTAAVNLSINAAAANLALHKTVVASTSYSGLPASNATDGNLNSRWSSEFSDNEWIYVDLGSVYTINRVVLRWEAAYGRGYKIQVSSDASVWSDASTTTTGDGGVDDIALASPASARYVRMLGTQRATVYGYSLYELEVYAQAAAPNLALGKPASASMSYAGLPASNVTDGNLSSRWSSGFSDSEWIYVDLGAVFTIQQVVLRWEAAYGRGYTIQVSEDASAWSDVYSTTTGDGGVDDITLAAPASGRYVRLLGTQRATEYGYSLWEFEVYA